VHGLRATESGFQDIQRVGPEAVRGLVTNSVSEFAVGLDLLCDLSGRGVGDRECSLPNAVIVPTLGHSIGRSGGKRLGLQSRGCQKKQGGDLCARTGETTIRSFYRDLKMHGVLQRIR
jgi:hypothetical protein